MVPVLLALLMGAVAGLRSMTAPAAVSWAAALGFLDLQDTWLAFLGYRLTPWILTALAIGELYVDLLPTTPSRKEIGGFAARIVTGALSGAAIGASGGLLWGGLAAGAVGAVAGTLGGAAGRARLAKAFRKDRFAALIEDAVAILGATLIVGAIP